MTGSTDIMPDNSGYIIENATNFLDYTAPPRELLLSPWLSSQSLNMIHAWRGVGKTHMALAIANAIATGSNFLGWSAAIEHRVFYIDGEMPIYALQQRLRQFHSINDNLIIFNAERQSNMAMPDLGTIEGQSVVDMLMPEDTKLIIIDNLSCLVGGKENIAESWDNIARWAIRKRSQGRSILFIHHSGKDGTQRGTSKREDILDCVISLKKPESYDADMGANFIVSFEKARHLCGQQIKPFNAVLEKQEDGNQKWVVKPIKSNRHNHHNRQEMIDKIVKLREDGMSYENIAARLNINRTTIYRYLNRY